MRCREQESFQKPQKIWWPSFSSPSSFSSTTGRASEMHLADLFPPLLCQRDPERERSIELHMTSVPLGQAPIMSAWLHYSTVESRCNDVNQQGKKLKQDFYRHYGTVAFLQVDKHGQAEIYCRIEICYMYRDFAVLRT